MEIPIKQKSYQDQPDLRSKYSMHFTDNMAEPYDDHYSHNLLEAPQMNFNRRGSYISQYTDRNSDGSQEKYQVNDGARANIKLMANFEVTQQATSRLDYDEPKLNYSIEPPQYMFERKEKQYKEVPDKWNAVYIFMVLFGIGSLTPFSAITTAIEYFNKSTRIFFCFSISAGLCTALPLIVYFLPDNIAWILSIVIMVFLGICMAVLSSSLAGLAGILPPRYMSAFMLGISLNAVGPLILRVITLAYFGLLDEVKYFFGALVFFASTGAFMLILAFGILFVIRQDVIIFNLVQTLEDIKDQDEDYDNQNVNKLIDANNTLEFNDAVFQCVQAQNKMTSLRDVWTTFKQIWIESLCLCLVYVTTMVCYPGIILQTHFTFISDESWFQVAMLSLYSIADIAGRFFTKYLSTKPSRFNEDPKELFDSDWFKIINILFIGFGNGFLGTILMMIGPYKVSNMESERAGQIMALFMTVGRGVGSMISGVGLYNTFKLIQESIRENYNDINFFK
ncbi:equilibrative nucleoside transporter [Stylonychia lemnae]|uniref:Equilibrative nucleoside transporter n=1 Tax=Stylonychia lemnae TaxID=5949 RepID=A0A077ZT70_STYLE|nr:equilibrative nucleoside transporter [Stylonychia lemnae]|eukprot:CDW71661.1 equilibrative nucleoside transporter [Stylonychia lemnae]